MVAGILRAVKRWAVCLITLVNCRIDQNVIHVGKPRFQDWKIVSVLWWEESQSHITKECASWAQSCGHFLLPHAIRYNKYYYTCTNVPNLFISDGEREWKDASQEVTSQLKSIGPVGVTQLIGGWGKWWTSYPLEKETQKPRSESGGILCDFKSSLIAAG